MASITQAHSTIAWCWGSKAPCPTPSYVLRARLEGGIRNKAARGELRRALPVGLVWGDADGEVRFHPDEAVTGVIPSCSNGSPSSARSVGSGSGCAARNLAFPSQISPSGEIRWGSPTYTAIHRVLTNPVYAGAYAYGKSRHERYVDDQGVVRQRVRRLPRAEWAVFIPDHHEGFIDWSTYEANQARIGANTRPQPHQSGGAVREGQRCSRASRPVAIAVGGCAPTIAAPTPRPATIAMVAAALRSSSPIGRRRTRPGARLRTRSGRAAQARGPDGRGEDDVLGYMAFPNEHRTKLHSTDEIDKRNCCLTSRENEDGLARTSGCGAASDLRRVWRGAPRGRSG